MKKIQMTTTAGRNGRRRNDRILWKMIKDELLLPFIDLNTEYYDLGLNYRNETDDQVTIDAAEATKKIWRCSKMCDNHTESCTYG